MVKRQFRAPPPLDAAGCLWNWERSHQTRCRRRTLKELADFACLLADEARAAIFAASREAVDKNEGVGGFDPVTEADKAAEARIRALIEAHYPDHGIQGEEFPDRPGTGRLAWSLDPIDGTRAFVCGLPSWTILIALLEDGAPVVGMIDVPALNERYVGHDGAARLILGGETRPIRTSGCRNLAEARLSTTDPYLFADAEAEGFERLRSRARLTRYGLDAYGYARLADGTIDLVVESGLKPHDYNALVPVVRGAGGVVGNWRGEADFSGGDLVAAATRELFEEAVRLLQR